MWYPKGQGDEYAPPNALLIPEQNPYEKSVCIVSAARLRVADLRRATLTCFPTANLDGPPKLLGSAVPSLSSPSFPVGLHVFFHMWKHTEVTEAVEDLKACGTTHQGLLSECQRVHERAVRRPQLEGLGLIFRCCTTDRIRTFPTRVRESSRP